MPKGRQQYASYKYLERWNDIMPIGMLIGLASAAKITTNAAQLGRFLRTGEEVIALTAVTAAGTAVAVSAIKPRK